MARFLLTFGSKDVLMPNSSLRLPNNWEVKINERNTPSSTTMIIIEKATHRNSMVAKVLTVLVPIKYRTSDTVRATRLESSTLESDFFLPSSKAF